MDHDKCSIHLLRASVLERSIERENKLYIRTHPYIQVYLDTNVYISPFGDFFSHPPPFEKVESKSIQLSKFTASSLFLKANSRFRNTRASFYERKIFPSPFNNYDTELHCTRCGNYKCMYLSNGDNKITKSVTFSRNELRLPRPYLLVYEDCC